MLRRIITLFAAFGALHAQQVVAPTPEKVGPPQGVNTGDYNNTQSFETGYRFALVGGDLGEYRSDVNYGNGIRLLGSSFTMNSKDGHGRFFDEIVLNTTGLGNDPYQSAILRIQKNELYRYDMNWRLSDYYNPGLTVAGGTHLEDTGRRLQDHELTLLPQSKVQFHLGYSRNTESGPALSTAQEFDAGGTGFPIFTDVRRSWNEYRLGAEANVAGFKFIVTRRWDFYKDDTPATNFGVQTASGSIRPRSHHAQSVQPIRAGPRTQSRMAGQPLHTPQALGRECAPHLFRGPQRFRARRTVFRPQPIRRRRQPPDLRGRRRRASRPGGRFLPHLYSPPTT